MSVCSFILTVLANALAGSIIFILGFLAYRMYFFRRKKIIKIQREILRYLLHQNGRVKDSQIYREILTSEGELKSVTKKVYPTTKAITQQLWGIEEIYKALKYGIKMDERYIEKLLNEMSLLGAAAPILDIDTSEVVGWKAGAWDDLFHEDKDINIETILPEKE